nr:MAG TPA: chromosome segregation ATPase [Caudoviricetes sp.]
MVTIEELKLGNKTLEALKFLLLQINELDVILNELNFEELREANNQAKTQIEVLNNIKTVVLNTEKSIEQVKASIDSRSEEINTTKQEIEDAKTNIIKAKDDTTLIYENISSKSERIEQKYNDIAEIKKEVDRKFDDIKNIEDQSRDIANEITNNKNITLRKIDENINTLNNTISNINILKSETLQEIATTKASIDTRANEALNTATSSLNEIKTILGDFRGKQTELNALKASLETLKSSLESLNKSGVINDTTAGIAQTYSSNKINNLLQGVLRESDASESNANGKLVRRNAQGNIYATNVYLNATTKAEVSDIKSSLATDKWRFIVRDTGEGLLRSMSIKDFINSQEVDAYKKSESDDKYLAKSDAGKLYRTQADSYSKTQTDLYFVRQNNVSEDNRAGDIVKRGEGGYINVGRINSNTSIMSTSRDVFSPDNVYSWTFGMFSENTLYRVKPSEIKGYLDTYYANKKTTESALWDRVSVSTKDKPNGYAGLNAKGKISSDLLPYTENVTELSNTLEINPSQGKNFIITLNNTSGTFSFYPIYLSVGQSGIIVVKGATRITGWNNNITWREIPTDLGETEVFSYFIANTNEVYMGRA